MNIRSYVARLLPAQPCFLCGAASHEGVCCAACARELPHLNGPGCTICAVPLPSGGVCGHCMRHPPAYDRTCAAFHYAFPLDSMIKALKFDEQLILADFLADALAARIAVQPDCLVDLPLHPSRLLMRGFNQSRLLADRLSRILHIPMLTDAAVRVRDTPPQSSLLWRARSRNMRKAFALMPGFDFEGKHVAIVDDVMTSGASIGALASLFKEAGAREVSACVIARTLPQGSKP